MQLVTGEHAGRSRFGGSPLLPEGQEWPSLGDEPTAFLCQVDLNLLPEADWGYPYPTHGLLSFFYSGMEDTDGIEPRDWHVLHFPPEAKLVETAAPGETYAANPIGFRLIDTYDPHQGVDVEDDVEGPRHQLFGFGQGIQNDEMGYCCEVSLRKSQGAIVSSAFIAECQAAADEWVLLLQVDSDPAAGFCWGDEGRLFFMIRKADLAAGRFDTVWVETQCY